MNPTLKQHHKSFNSRSLLSFSLFMNFREIHLWAKCIIMRTGHCYCSTDQPRYKHFTKKNVAIVIFETYSPTLTREGTAGKKTPTSNFILCVFFNKVLYLYMLFYFWWFELFESIFSSSLLYSGDFACLNTYFSLLWSMK